MKVERSNSRTGTMARLARALRIFLRSEVGGKAWFLIGALVVLMLCINGMNVLNSYVGRDFMSSIERRDHAGFVRYAWTFVMVYALSTGVAVLFRFAEERIALLWRDWLTRRAVRLYLGGRDYLLLKESATMSNPDQRIAEDVKALTVSTVSFVLMIANGTVTAISFSGVLWSISPKLFLVSVVYAVIGSTLTFLLGKPLMRLNYRQSDCEADFRADLIRVRENAESIALEAFEPGLRGQLNKRIDALVGNYRRLIAVNRNLGFFTTGYNYLIQLIPALFVAPLFISGQAEFGIIGQAAMAFCTLLGAFSLVVTQFQAISSYASVATRLSEFTDAIELTPVHAGVATAIPADEHAAGLTFNQLTVAVEAGGPPVLKALHGVVRAGRPVLISGPNEAAKQALLRTAAGLHLPLSGAIRRPPQTGVAFLPEQPYLPPLPLRALLTPHGSTGHADEETLAAVLRDTGLTATVERLGGLDACEVWTNVLTFAEQHLVMVARTLVAKPAYVFLDRLEAALDDTQFQQVLALFARDGITCLIIAGSGAAPSPGQDLLEFLAGGSWRWHQTVPASDPDPAA